MGGKGSGGERQGQQGKTYTNRTDLAANRTAQQAPTPVTSPGATTPSAPSMVPQVQPQLPMLNQSPPGDELYQSARPNEPVTHGLVGGPGAGPEVLPNQSFDINNSSMSDMIAAIAAKSGNSSLNELAMRAKQLGQ